VNMPNIAQGPCNLSAEQYASLHIRIGAAIPGLEVCVAAVVDTAGFCAEGGGACMPRIVALVRTV
jgi:hypothetical protein